MEPSKRVLERAFELARSGGCVGVSQIRGRLKEEGYSNSAIAQVYGVRLLTQLRGLCQDSKAADAARVAVID